MPSALSVEDHRYLPLNIPTCATLRGCEGHLFGGRVALQRNIGSARVNVQGTQSGETDYTYHNRVMRSHIRRATFSSSNRIEVIAIY